MKLYRLDEYEDIAEVLSGRSLIFFGAGKGLNELCERIGNFYFDSAPIVKYVVDNNESSWEDYRTVLGQKIHIKSPEYLRRHIEKGQVIIISTQYLHEILAQLNSMYELDDVEALYYEDINIAQMMRELYLPDSFRITDKPLIPKVIHYCWFGGNPIPDRYREWMKTWKKYCPDYDIVEWNESNYDYKKNEYMYEAYKSKKWGFVPDYARLDIIHEYGGIYLDTDVELLKNLDDLLYQRGFMGLQGNLLTNNGLGFGAVAGHEVIKSQLTDYMDRKFIKDDGSLDITVGPVYQTDVMTRLGFKQKNLYQVVNDMTILPAPVLGGIIGSKLVKHPCVYAIHHYDGSWASEERKLKQNIWRNLLNESIKAFRESNRM